MVRPQDDEQGGMHLPQGPRSAAERWAALPLGELHPTDVCRYCGTKGDLMLTVFRDTNAIGPRCVDSVACIRRRHP